MIVIIDYGVGNVHSILNMFKKIGVEAKLSESPEELLLADKVILPGVGSFDYGMKQLKETGYYDFVLKYAKEIKRPLLGICLGMQMLFETSDEGGTVNGLGLLPGRVLKFAPDMGLKVPAIGWNDLKTVSHPDLTAGDYVYFVHSYYCRPDRALDVAATSEYGIEFASAVSRGNILATQFHPEKSGEAGLSILNRWARRTK